MQNQSFVLSRDTFNVIRSAFYTAIDNRDTDIFRELNTFLHNQMSECVEYDNIDLFNSFSEMFPYYYEYALKKHNLSITITDKDIYKTCADSAANGIKARSKILNYRLMNETNIDEKLRINKFQKILLDRFSEVINVCFRNEDLTNIKFILNELNEISEILNFKLNQLKGEIEIKKLKRSRLSEGELEQLSESEKSYTIESFTNKTVRLTFKVTLFWALFLYKNGVLTIDEIEKIITYYEGNNLYGGYNYSYIESNFTEDLIELRKQENHYSWETWNYIEKMNRVDQSTPYIEYWATFGAILYFLMNNGQRNLFQFQYISIDNINSYEYLKYSMQEISSSLKLQGFELFGSLLKIQDEKEFNEKIDQLERKIKSLDKSITKIKETEISKIPIDTEIVKSFKSTMCEAWKRDNILREIFIYFEKIVSVKQIPKGQEFDLIGSRDEIWRGVKFTVINDESRFYNSIGGLEMRGHILSSSEENNFWRYLNFEKRNIVQDILPSINLSISNIKKAKFNPSIIIMGIDIWNRHFLTLKNENFSFDWTNKQGFPFSDFGGTYMNLPIVKFRSNLLDNVIIVADFEKSFELHQLEQENGYENVLVNEIKEITDTEAEGIIKQNTAYWQRDSSFDEAKLKLMNSIRVDFYLTEKFVVLNEDAYSLMVVE
jgi:hypothetical protein